jgi:hypothetical protein
MTRRLKRAQHERAIGGWCTCEVQAECACSNEERGPMACTEGGSKPSPGRGQRRRERQAQVHQVRHRHHHHRHGPPSSLLLLHPSHSGSRSALCSLLSLTALPLPYPTLPYPYPHPPALTSALASALTSGLPSALPYPTSARVGFTVVLSCPARGLLTVLFRPCDNFRTLHTGVKTNFREDKLSRRQTFERTNFRE